MKMDFCLIDAENQKYFNAFIPGRMALEIKDRNCLTLGMFDERGPLGAVVFRKRNAVMEIFSLDYLNSLEPGECEKALVEFADKQNWDVYRLEYIVGGSREFFDDYDFVMLDAGFVPSRGNVKKFHATLGTAAKSQKEILSLFGKTKDVSEFKIGKSLTKHDIDSYNNLYPYNRYLRDENNEELSCFMFKKGEVVAGIIARDEGNGRLEFEWMDARGLAIQEVMKLIVFTTVNAIKKYPPETEVIICPFDREVEGLVGRFGFEESPGHIETRIYSYYL